MGRDMTRAVVEKLQNAADVDAVSDAAFQRF